MTADEKAGTPPLNAAGFRILWEGLGAPRALLLAVSGGADSMALMSLAAPLAREGVRICVATVDHALRAGSAEEAAFVGAVARSLSLEHRILAWRGPKPETGLQAGARAARYRLLALEAETHELDAVLTAHSADDQAETVMMRLARGSGPRGLAAMPHETAIAAGAGKPVRLLRPLLSETRLSLRAIVGRAGLGHVDDPSNADERFERVRVRRALSDLDAQGLLTTRALLEVAARAREAANRLALAEEEVFRAGRGSFSPNGSALLDAASIDAARDGGLIARLINAVSGSMHEPNAARVGAVVTAALAGRTGTLGGAIILVCGGELVVAREPAAALGRHGDPAPPETPLDPGECALWDGRFIVTNPFPFRVVIRALGEGAEAGLASHAAPGLWLDGRLVAFPGEPGLEDQAFRSLAEERFYRRVNRFV
jgi:tRNA(Ile)-lysidine synthase